LFELLEVARENSVRGRGGRKLAGRRGKKEKRPNKEDRVFRPF